MKKAILISMLTLLLNNQVAFTTTNNESTKKENNVFKEKPENFVYINKDCKLCMISRSAKAGCVIPKDGKILLVKDKHSDKFELPSGKKKINEPAFLTAVQKTLETTGYLVYIDDFISEFSSGFRLFKCKIIDEDKQQVRNHLEIKWVDKKELQKFLKKENRKKLRFPNELDLIYGKFEWVLK